MYVFAVTARLRWPTRCPILAHGSPRQMLQRYAAVAQVVRAPQAQADLAAQLEKNLSYGRDEVDLDAKHSEAVAELDRLENLEPKSKS